MLGVCRVVAFLSGGKCGSTALASYLKHAPPDYVLYDHTSQFYDTGKELCGQLPKTNCTAHILDACPRRVTKIRAEQTLKIDPAAVGVLLVRSQADALLSLYRDIASSGRVGGMSADEWVLLNLSNQQYNFTAAFNDAVHWGFEAESIVVIKSAEMKRRPEIYVNRVRMAAGLLPVKITVPQLFNNPVVDRSRYREGSLSYTTRQRVEHHWHNTNLEFARLTGVVV